jgi:hypothetical protein
MTIAGKDIHVTPAYGRDYRDEASAVRAWEAGKDWILRDPTSRWNGKPINKEDAHGIPGAKVVLLRFNNDTQHAVVKVGSVSVVVLKVAARYCQAMEFPTEEAKKKYLKEHPDADPSRHSVKKTVKPDTASAASKAESRGKETDQHFDTMKGLLKKVEDVDSSAGKKFDSVYKKLFENGEEATKAAKKLLKQLDNADLDEDSQVFAALEMLHNSVRNWESNKLDHVKAGEALADKKLRQAESTAGYAKKIDEWISKVHQEVK